MHERLDETIDRVAGEMTTVAGDPALTARVRERMDGLRRVWLLPTLAAASVAGVVVIAIALWPRAEQIQAPDPAGRELSARAVAPVAALAPPQQPVWHDEPARPVVGEAVTRLRGRDSLSAVALAEAGASPTVEDRDPVSPRLALAWVDADEPAGPAPLAIAELTIAPLAMLDVPEIAPLRIESLQIAEIGLEQAKERR